MSKLPLSGSPDVEDIIKQTSKMARSFKSEYATVEILSLALTINAPFREVLEEYDVDVDSLVDDLRDQVISTTVNLRPVVGGFEPKKTTALERVINRAFTQVMFNKRTYIQPADLYISITNETSSYAAYIFSRYIPDRVEFIEFYNDHYSSEAPDAPRLSATEIKESLEEHCTDMSSMARNGKLDPVIGREREINQLVKVLSKRNKSNALMVGEAGVGKTSIVEGLALAIAEKRVPDHLQNYTVYSLDVGDILAGCKYRGDFEEKVKVILESLIAHGKAILCIDEAHQIQGAGSGTTSQVDMSNMLKPAIAKGQLKVVASTTWEEYSQTFEKDRAFMRRFYRIAVDEPTSEVAVEILRGLRSKFEQHHSCTITDDALDAAVAYSVRHLTDKKLPDKAIDLVDAACAHQRQQNKRNFTIDKLEILHEVSDVCRIPVSALDDENASTDVLNLAASIKERVFGQDTAVEQVVEQVMVARAGLKDPTKPIGSFLFVGPTGTGKTELCKRLAEQTNMTLLRYDMGEYQEKHTVSRLIGSPPGYVGHDSAGGGGKLISDLEKHPHAVILFDEIEKAHPDVTNVLLSMMDEGIVTAGNGKVADCRNCVIVLTSNLGAADSERNKIGFGSQEKTGVDDAAIKKYFKPEFRNRISAICKFNKLTPASMQQIVEKFVREIEVLVAERSIKLSLLKSAVDYLAQHGFDAKMGARPAYRLINEQIRVPLSRLIVEQKLSNCTVKIKATDAGLELNVAAPRKPRVKAVARDASTENAGV